MIEKSMRMITDIEDTLIFSPRENGGFFIEILKNDSGTFIEVPLSKVDIDNISKIIHNEVDE